MNRKAGTTFSLIATVHKKYLKKVKKTANGSYTLHGTRTRNVGFYFHNTGQGQGQANIVFYCSRPCSNLSPQTKALCIEIYPVKNLTKIKKSSQISFEKVQLFTTVSRNKKIKCVYLGIYCTTCPRIEYIQHQFISQLL